MQRRSATDAAPKPLATPRTVASKKQRRDTRAPQRNQRRYTTRLVLFVPALRALRLISAEEYAVAEVRERLVVA